MENLQRKLRDLQGKYSQKAKVDEAFRDTIRSLVPSSYKLKETNFTKDTVTLVAANKATAQELFLMRDSLARELKKEVVIR